MSGVEGEKTPEFKITMIGDSGVGKSSILVRFTDDNFEEDQACTIGVDFKTKKMDVGGRSAVLNIWDTAGQEKFRSLTGSYYRGTQGIILVYDVNQRQSFESISNWLEEVDHNTTNPDIILLLVGNKVDKQRQVTREEGLKFAQKNQMLFIECSAKTKVGVQQTFEELVQKILDTPSLWAADKKQTVSPNQSQPDLGAPACSC